MNLISRFWVVITKYWYRGTIKRIYKLITYAYTINEYQIAFSSYQTQHKLNLCLQGLFDIYNIPSECLNLFRKLYTPTSTIYHAPEIDKGLSDRLTSSQFDLSKPSGKNKELKPHGRNDAPRGQGRVRAIGGHKTREYLFYKGWGCHESVL